MLIYIDEKFKEVSPEETVEKIKGILDELGIETEEHWNESGLENCYSLRLKEKDGTPFATNGKGVSKALARASAYAEFIERVQGGLSFFKYQNFISRSDMYIQNYAPDVKYITTEELISQGEWMDYLIEEYGGNLSRNVLADFCKLYAFRDDGKIAVLPFYSLFEKKYVYLPIGFVDQVYGTNGCCAGNTRDEAWVHALSEILERRSSLQVLISGKAAPAIPEETLHKYPIVSKIINQVRESGKYDVSVLDYSLDTGFPIVATRVINKENQAYLLNVAADPVFEIAIERTLTEMFQGRNIKNFSTRHNSVILKDISNFPIKSNVLNQLETSNGVYTADFFAEEITCEKEFKGFEDNSDKSNTDLLHTMLNLFKRLGRPVYVRNFSFLGFQSYRFVVPGFSEAEAIKLQDMFFENLAVSAGKTLKNIAAANAFDLTMFTKYSKEISTLQSRYPAFNMLSGVPLSTDVSYMLSFVTRSFAAFTLKLYAEAAAQLDMLANRDFIDIKTRKYFACLSKYIKLTQSGISSDKVRVILGKFFENEYTDMLYEKIDNGRSPYEDYLLKCDNEHCEGCRYANNCSYAAAKRIIGRVGVEYQKFTQGQHECIFNID